MRLSIEIHCDRMQSALLETEQNSRSQFFTRSMDDGVAVHVRGQQRYRWRGRLTVTALQLAPVDGQGDHHVQSLTGKAAARFFAWHLLRLLAVDVGVGGVTQPQLDARADLIFQRRSDLCPARCRQHHVYTERKPLRRQGSDRLLERFELMAQGCPAIDDKENIAKRIGAGYRIGQMGLPRADDRFHFGDHARNQLMLAPAGDSARTMPDIATFAYRKAI